MQTALQQVLLPDKLRKLSNNEKLLLIIFLNIILCSAAVIAADYLTAEKDYRNLVDEIFNLIKLYFIEAGKNLKKRYPNIKFLIIKYLEEMYDNTLQKDIYCSERWKELEDEGFIVYDLKEKLSADLNSDEYFFYADFEF